MLSSIFDKSLPVYQNIFFRFNKCFIPLSKIKSYSGSAYDHDNIKKIKLMKGLVSTLLFGGTLLVAIWCRKMRKSEALSDCTLLKMNCLYRKNFFLYDYKGFIFPSFVMKNMDSVQKFECKKDDIFVVSFPKTGTTWLQEIIYCIAQDLDFKAAKEKSIEDRFPYLEFIYPGLSSIEGMIGQRFIKTHLPYSLLPPDVFEKKPKIFYIMRNPKDVTVSYYHFVRMITMTEYIGNLEDFFQDMLTDKVPYGPIWKHYADIWDHKDDKNILLLFYEDFHKDIYGNIKKIAEFLGKDLSDNEVQSIADHCSFAKMSTNPSVNFQHWDELGVRNKKEAKFMRKGQVGDWKNYFTAEMSSQMENWINEHLGNLGLHFTYEILHPNE